MAISVVMPALEMAQETGKLLAWRKKEGEPVVKGEPLLEIETDKAVVEVEAPGDGILAGITAQAGAEIPVGQTIAWLVQPGEAPPVQSGPAAPSARGTSAQERAAVTTAAAAPGPSAAAAPQISPKARRLAQELGIDVSQLRGTGPDGVITAEDVQAAANAKVSPAAAPAEGEKLSQIARLMAERTSQSWTTVPHFFVVRDVDATELRAAHQRLGPAIEKSRGVRVTLTDLLIALVARVLRKHPRVNSMWTGQTIRPNPDVNISVAMAVEDGVVGAVIRKADTLEVGEISAQRRDLTDRARANKLRPADISGGTFTISNLGMYEVDAFTAIITPPQAAILAVGGMADRVVPVDGKPEVRPVMTLTLSSDHRVIDGARAAQFMKDLADALRAPNKSLE
ncbi:MAG: 2-oxo acid dehydrogenase subunit E2 [Acidobacteriia bacterium]|nr:2-oxo acid dehydrogenase subunit E2 [Terriglobia bacterium]